MQTWCCTTAPTYVDLITFKALATPICEGIVHADGSDDDDDLLVICIFSLLRLPRRHFAREVASCPLSTHEELLKRQSLAAAQVGRGLLSRAMKTLRHETRHPVTEDTLLQLAAKHPPAPSPDLSAFLPSSRLSPCVPQPLCLLLYNLCLRKARDGKAPGPSGLGYDFLILDLLFNNQACYRAFAVIFQRMCRGTLPPPARDLLCASRLVGIPKSQGLTRTGQANCHLLKWKRREMRLL